MSVRGLTKSFGDHKVISGFNLELHEGEILCLLGINGSGKTTLINMLTGLHDTDSGDVTLHLSGN